MRLSMAAYVMRLAVTPASVVLASVVFASAPPALAQDAQPRAPMHRRPPLRIEVTPSPQLYRQCADWHVIEHRPTGDTVVPRSRCWWAAR
jgi:hypothetical protein